MLIVLSSTFSASLLVLDVVEGSTIVLPVPELPRPRSRLDRVVDQRQQHGRADPLGPAVVDIAIDTGFTERAGAGRLYVHSDASGVRMRVQSTGMRTGGPNGCDAVTRRPCASPARRGARGRRR